ncbi:hypothetical protein BN1723_000902 [Verticillium longisporum]|uniref:Methyltransferase domain-containing protein n=1 Tax=Verticillium longisporum TaxID=100787 RepID=A0A0G4NC45_VERLO|nr:hypothetical protein BN1723_000902 [Verticillium longisporum]
MYSHYRPVTCLLLPLVVPLPPDLTMEETPDFLENGRRYASFLGRRYLLPIDSDEKNRLDFFHAIVRLARGGKLFGMHLPPHPRVLDLGTGTGIWAIDVSDQLWEGSHEHAIVDGLDLSPIQPREVPLSVSFTRTNIEGPWPLPPGYDLIHVQMLLGSICDWKGIYERSFSYLRPGGYLEHVEIGWKFFSDDGTLQPSSSLAIWSEELHRAMRRAGTPLDVDEETQSKLRITGFVDVTESVINLPINTWSDQPNEKKLGTWFNGGLSLAADVMSLAPLTRIERQATGDILKLVRRMKEESCRLSIHGYCKLVDMILL